MKLAFNDELEELARRRGFFWPSYEIYGGTAGLYDIGPNGIKVKQKIENLWRDHFITSSLLNIVEIETPMVTPQRVLEASGHVESFTDPLVICPKCHRVYRADQLAEAQLKIKTEGMALDELKKLYSEKEIVCEACGTRLLDIQSFNLLFHTYIGPFTAESGFLRPETAQGIFTAFKRTFEAERKKLPLGVAQVGRVARNEISPRQSLIRMREFTIMEFEFFFDPDQVPDLDSLQNKIIKIRLSDNTLVVEKMKDIVARGLLKHPWMGYFMASAVDFMEKIGFTADEVTFQEKSEKERAHYSAQTFDVIVSTKRWGDVEVAGIAYRTNYDLRRHSEFSGQDLSVSVQLAVPVTKKVTHVWVNRAALGKKFGKYSVDIVNALNALAESAKEEELGNKEKIILNLPFGKVEITSDLARIEFKEETVSSEKIYPHVVEPSFGADRLLYAVLDHSLRNKEDRRILSLPKAIAPYDIAVFPLVEEEKLVHKARAIFEMLKKTGFDVLYDEDGTIGRRYARVDEIGVPWAITVDEESIAGRGVTIRDRDSWTQWRVNEARLSEAIEALRKGLDLKLLGFA